MPDTINFVRERRRQLTKLEVRDRLWFKWSAIGLSVVLGITLVLLGGRAWLQWQSGQVLGSIDTAKKTIASQEKTERTVLIFHEKLKVLQQIFAERSEKQEALLFFTQVFGPQVLIREIEYDATQRLLSFGLQAPDVFTLEQVFKILDGPEVTEKFGAVSRSDLRRGAEGSYDIKVTITLPGQVATAGAKK